MFFDFLGFVVVGGFFYFGFSSGRSYERGVGWVKELKDKYFAKKP